MNVLILEDEQRNFNRLRRQLEEIDTTFHVEGPLANIQESVEWLRTHPTPDLILADIRLSDGLSFDVLRQTAIPSPIIFTTAYDEYAIQAFKYNSFDYLLKPVTYERVAQLLDELSSLRPAATDELVIKTSFGYHALRLSDIEYAEARNKHVIFHLRDGRDIEALEPFRSIEDRLAQNATFFKCHRSYQVNLRNIDHFNRTEIVMRSGACIPLARSCKQGFQDAYFAVRFEGGRR